jgi:hypothetical protein
VVGDQPVGFPVDPDRGVGVWCLDKAEDLAALLVDPVLEVVDPVLVLGPDVGFVGLGDVLGGGSLRKALVHVHEQRHRTPLCGYSSTLRGQRCARV